MTAKYGHADGAVQPSLFVAAGEQCEARLEAETTVPPVSGVGDSRLTYRLGTLVAQLARASGALDRAQAAAQVRDLAEVLFADNVRAANVGGTTWRDIGARLGVPFQTLYGRYGTSARPGGNPMHLEPERGPKR